jgi:F-type H+-transporting ATPase subunit gamma
MLSNIVSSSSSDISLPLAEERPAERVLLIPITSDRGLCGAYNANVVKMTRQVIDTKYAAQHAKKNVTILPIGKKGYEYFTRYGYKVVSEFWEIYFRQCTQRCSICSARLPE